MLYDIDPETSKKALAELYKTRDRTVIDDLIEAAVASRFEPWMLRGSRKLSVQWFAQRALRGLGDENGDIYDVALKRLTDGKTGQYADHAGTLTRLLARWDSKRALGDFKKLLMSDPREVRRDMVIWAIPRLESEEGLDLLFEHLGEPGALDVRAGPGSCRILFAQENPGWPEWPTNGQHWYQSRAYSSSRENLPASPTMGC